MSGIQMKNLLDYVANTGPAILGPPEQIVNQIQRNSYALGRFMSGPAAEFLQGGNKILATLYLDHQSSFQIIDPNQDFSYTNPQKDKVIQTDWAFTVDSMTWLEQEVMLQSGSTGGSNIATKYRDMIYSKMQGKYQSMIDGWEDILWTPPAGAQTYASMEGDGAGRPYSIPAFVHENAGNNGGFDANWTNLHGQPLSVYGDRFDNYRGTYDPGQTSTAEDDHLFSGFDDVAVEIGYRPPGFKDEYFEGDNSYPHGNKWAQSMYIMTSKAGVKQVMRAHRASNDSLINPQDAQYAGPSWRGVPIMDVATLDKAELYTDGSGGFVTESDNSVDEAGPRYYFLNPKYLKMIWHSDKFFSVRDPKEPTDKIGVFVTVCEAWGNMICTSRRHQGILSPVASA